jgi:hypothetical protein
VTVTSPRRPRMRAASPRQPLKRQRLEQCPPLPVGQRAGGAAGEVQHVEDDQRRRRHQPGRADHAAGAGTQPRAQPLEVRKPLVVETDQLAVEQHLVVERIGQRAQLSKLSRPVAPHARAHRHPPLVEAQLRPHAIPLDLQGPIPIGGDLVGGGQEHWRDEVRKALDHGDEVMTAVALGTSFRPCADLRPAFGPLRARADR